MRSVVCCAESGRQSGLEAVVLNTEPQAKACGMIFTYLSCCYTACGHGLGITGQAASLLANASTGWAGHQTACWAAHTVKSSSCLPNSLTFATPYSIKLLSRHCLHQCLSCAAVEKLG